MTDSRGIEFSISIRVTFPDEITSVLKQEKERFIAQYGSSYKSEPHITLYLDRYTEDGYPKLLKELEGLQVKPFVVSLLPPKIRIENDRHRNLYIMDVSNKQELQHLHEQITAIAIPYQSRFLREKTIQRFEKQGIHTDGARESLKAYNMDEEAFDPHITLGEIDFDKPQADIAEVEKNLKSIEGKEITVSSVAIFAYKKEANEEKAKLIDEVIVPFHE